MALSATLEWDVRTTGADVNGGAFRPGSGGTDYSQQDAAQVTYADLVIGGTATQLTSAAFPFTSAHVGNLINVSGGAGFTAGRYEILSVAGGVANMDRAVGTASSVGGSGKLGGATTLTGANLAAASGNILHIKAGTYVVTATVAVPQATNNVAWIGYGAVHNDGGTKPLITTSTNSTPLISTTSTGGGRQVFQNLKLTNTAATRASGIVQVGRNGGNQSWIIDGCILDGFTVGVDTSNVGAAFVMAHTYVVGSEIMNCSTAGVSTSAAAGLMVMVSGCWLHGNSKHLLLNLTGPSFTSVTRTIFAAATGDAIATVGTGGAAIVIGGCVFYGNAGAGVQLSSTNLDVVWISNTAMYGNGSGVNSVAGGLNTAGSAAAAKVNAFGANTGGNPNWPATPTDIALTANPFVNPASGDFALNAAAGGGALLKAAGFPAVLPTGNAQKLDIGAVQGGGGGGGAFTFIGG